LEKEASENFCDFIESFEEGIVIYNGKGKLICSNSACDRIVKNLSGGKRKELFLKDLFNRKISKLTRSINKKKFTNMHLKGITGKENCIIKIKEVDLKDKSFLLVIFQEESFGLKRGYEEISKLIGDNLFFWRADIKISSDFYYTFVTDGIKKITGYSKEDFISNKVLFSEMIYEKDWHFFEDYLIKVFSGIPASTEYRIVTKEGRKVWIMDNSIPYFENGELMRVDGICMEITERKKREKDYRTILSAVEQVSEAIMITNEEGKIVYVNSAFVSITGYSIKEIIGKTPRVLISGKHDDEFYKRIWDTIQKGKTWSGFVICKRKDGTIYEEGNTITPLKDKYGNITNYIAIKRDLTERRRLEQQLRQAQKMEAIGNLAGGVAHDFNNVLGAIMGYISILKRNFNKGEKEFETLIKMEKLGFRAKDLVSKLLGFARKGKMESRIIDLNKQIEETISLLSDTIDRRIVIKKELDDNISYIKGDPEQIKQVLVNIGLNAVQAITEGGDIKYSTYNFRANKDFQKQNPGAEKGNYVVIEIEDTGVGMSKETKDRIFEPFFTTKKENQGTGLGLSTVYGIVKNHRGYIKAFSEKSKGSVFYVFFPAAKEDKISKGFFKDEEITEESYQSETRKGNILIADDEELIRDMLKDVLETSGYTVFEAKDGEEAEEFYRKNFKNIDLVLLDINMPKKNGKQTFLEMQKVDNSINVIILTGFAVNEEVQYLIDNGAKGYLHKPFKIPELLKKVDSFIK